MSRHFSKQGIIYIADSAYSRHFKEKYQDTFSVLESIMSK